MRLDAPNLVHPTPVPRHNATLAHPRPLIRRALRALRAAAIVAAVLFAVLAWTTRSSNPSVVRALKDSGAVRSVLSLLRSPSGALVGEHDDHIAVLLLGMGGEGHEGPLLTDTILVASFQPKAKRIVLTSIPRDLAVPIGGDRFEKANAINAYAEADDHGSGGKAAARAVGSALGIAIPYYVRVDFAGFAGLIDDLGGVDVEVERTLDDPQYPIAGKEDAPWEERFERLLIPAGRVHMDGALALKYVRSRHGKNGEGSDFARGRRQQQLLLAVRERASARALVANPSHALALLGAWREHVATNLDPPQLVRLAGIGARMADTAAIARIVFTDTPDGELSSTFVAGSYVLRPRDGTYTAMRAKFTRALAGTPPSAAVAEERAPASTALIAEVWNGTSVNGLAARVAERITEEGFTVRSVRNAPTRSVMQTMIYYRPRVSAVTVERLRMLFRAESSTIFPNFSASSETTDDPPDLLVILGTSTSSTAAEKESPIGSG